MSSPVRWQASPDALTLALQDLHLWLIELDSPYAPLERSPLERYAGMLDADERARADAFHFDRDRRRFVAAHGAVRSILARYLHVSPQSIAYRRSAYGKPSLDLSVVPGASDPSPELSFNLSHSGDRALLAVTKGRRVGVDIEQVRPDLADLRVAARFFARAEVDALAALSSEDRATAFFRCWTRKEAFVKARGEGLSLPLDRFVVSLDPHAPRLLATLDDPAEALRWSFQVPNPAPGYEAAVVTEGSPPRLSCWQMSHEL